MFPSGFIRTKNKLPARLAQALLMVSLLAFPAQGASAVSYQRQAVNTEISATPRIQVKRTISFTHACELKSATFDHAIFSHARRACENRITGLLKHTDRIVVGRDNTGVTQHLPRTATASSHILCG